MTLWLKQLTKELDAVTDEQAFLAEPYMKVRQEDHVVGIADLGIRKLFFLVQSYQKSTLEAVASLMLINRSEREAKMPEIAYLEKKTVAIKENFWMSCHVAFPELWGKSVIGIREDWQVVWSDSEDSQLKTSQDMLNEVIEAKLREGPNTDSKAASDETLH